MTLFNRTVLSFSVSLFASLVCCLSAGAADPLQKTVDNFDPLKGWQAIQGGGNKLEMTSEKGLTGNALCINYSLVEKGAYVVAAKELSIPLPQNFEFSFYIKGTGPDNNLEFKLMDEKGNTFRKNFENFKFPEKWKKIVIPKEDIVYAWGPDKDTKLSKISKMEIAVSRSSGGQGTVCIDELALTELPPTASEERLDYGKIKISASGAQDADHPEKYAMDNNMATRWSSPFSDPQWLKIDLGETKDIAGLVIYWEAAFASAYDVLLSQDDKEWKTVYATENGDGNSDELYFKKQSARYVKILGRKRGTGWGYSLFEVKVIGAGLAPAVTASSGETGAQNIIDGNMKSVWSAANKGAQNIVIDFRKTRIFGGFILHWNSTGISQKTLSISNDNKEWEKLFSPARKNNDTDYIYLEGSSGRYIKIEAASEKEPVSLKEIIIKGPDEKLTRERGFEIAALQSPKGFYPRWLHKEQEYWTVVGVVDDLQESLVSESGSVEPWHNSYSFSPFLRLNGKLLTYADAQLTQSLDEGYLPIPSVKWSGKECDLTVDVFAADAGEKSSTYMKYTIKNKTKGVLNGEFYLTLCPMQINPPWMHGGLADVSAIAYDSKNDASMMQVNGKNALFVPQKPDKYGTSSYKRENFHGDIVEDIDSGNITGGEAEFKNSDGLGSAGLGYSFNLKPAESLSYYFIVPLHDKDNEIDTNLNKNNITGSFDAKRLKIKDFWVKKLERIKINIPEKEFVDTLKSNVAYILINDDRFRLQPGSRNYEMSWMRDGSLMASSLLGMGYNDEVKRYLGWISGFIKPDGWVPFMVDIKDESVTHGWKEFDSQGEYIYAIFQYYLFNRDKNFLADKKQKVIDDINFIKARRAERKTAEYSSNPDKKEFYGIFPESASHEGYIDPPRHSYWDDFWALRGLRDAEKIFTLLDDKEKSKWAFEERMDFKKALYDSINTVIKKKNINFIPGCAELGDGDPTSTAIAMWPCGEMENLPKNAMSATFDMYWNELQKRFKEDWTGGFTPYEIRNANAFIMLGQRDKLHKMMTKFFEWKRPRAWNHWAEVVTSDERLAQYLGDMPHTWIAAEYVNVIRNMFIFEQDETLYLGKGIAAEWVAPGKTISLVDMPTHFGKISYAIESKNDGIGVRVSGTLSNVEKIVLVVPPTEKEILDVKLNGKSVAGWRSGEIAFKKLPAEIFINTK